MIDWLMFTAGLVTGLALQARSWLMKAVPFTEAYDVDHVDIERGVAVLADGSEIQILEWYDEDEEVVPAGLATWALGEADDGACFYIDLVDEGKVH